MSAHGAPAPTAACAGAGTTAAAMAFRCLCVQRKGLFLLTSRRCVRVRAAPNKSNTGATVPRKRFSSSPPGGGLLRKAAQESAAVRTGRGSRCGA